MRTYRFLNLPLLTLIAIRVLRKLRFRRMPLFSILKFGLGFPLLSSFLPDDGIQCLLARDGDYENRGDHERPNDGPFREIPEIGPFFPVGESETERGYERYVREDVEVVEDFDDEDSHGI